MLNLSTSATIITPQGENGGKIYSTWNPGISKPAVSRALDSLERKGFVTRQPGPDDRRAQRVRLTDEARKIGPAIEQIYNHVYTLAIQGVLQEEFENFASLFGRMSQNFERKQQKVEQSNAS